MDRKILVCKKTGKEFYDIDNISGSLTTHLLTVYDDIDVPSNNYQRKKYEKLHGKRWFDDYFTLITKEVRETRKCHICDWETVDVENKSGSFENHLKQRHSMSIEEYLAEYPEDIKYHTNYIKKQELLSDDRNFVTCLMCGEKMKMITNTHLSNVHGISMEEYKLKYPNSPVSSKTTSEKLSNQCQKMNSSLTPTWTSSGEREIIDFIVDMRIDVKKGTNRTLLNGKEIDIIIPSHGMAIEYNGLYYHTEKMGKTPTYHLSKTTECFKNGYRLLQIFEDEWMMKKDIVKGKIKHLLGKSVGIRIGGRNVTIKPVLSKVKNEFLDCHHIQGSVRSNIAYGAYYHDMLVGVICFNKDRNMSKRMDGVYDMVRFAVHRDYVINGLCSKFIKRFINDHQPNKIITFADRRWTPDGNDNLYIKIGFTLTNILRPSYTYYNSKVSRYRRFHKFMFGKTNLKKKYPDIDINQSEKTIMESLGYSRIWDCGLFKYELNVNEKKGD